MAPLPDRRWVTWSALPEDMQVILGDYLRLDGITNPEGLWAAPLAVARLPRALLDDEDAPLSAEEADAAGVDRGVAYARAMVLDATPPIVVAHGHWLDGRHRVFAAREQQREWVWAFDLTEQMPDGLGTFFHLGSLGPEPPSRRRRPRP